MPESYTVPALATTNAIISSSDANVDKADLRYFRQFITNPAGANLVLLSNGTDGAAFNTVPDIALTNQKVNQVNPQYSTFGTVLDKGSGMFDVSATGDAPNASGDSWLVVQNRHWNWGADYRWQLAVQFTNADQMWARSVIAGVGSTWRRLFHTGFMGTGSGLDAALFGGQLPAFYATAASVAAINQVPSGLIASVATAAGIPSGWTRYTNGDGRLLVGAGTTFGQTFAENTAYGANWTPFAGATVPASGESPFLAAAASSNNSSGATNVNTAGHTHALAAQTWTPVARAVVHVIKS